MIIEILYPEVANLHGEQGNIVFLENSFTSRKIIKTELNQKPYFVDNQVDFIYMGSVNEINQQLIINNLKPYASELKSIIKKGSTKILFTGNALEVLGKSITYEDKKVEALGIFDFNSFSSYKKRFNSFILGEYEGLEILGYISQFSYTIYNDQPHFLSITLGSMPNSDNNYEGLVYNNCYLTYLLGPILIINPLFSDFLFNTFSDYKPPVYQDKLIDAYNQRLKEYKERV